MLALGVYVIVQRVDQCHHAHFSRLIVLCLVLDTCTVIFHYLAQKV